MVQLARPIFVLRLIPLGLLLSLLLAIGVLGSSTPTALADNGSGTGTDKVTLGTPVPLAETFHMDLKGDYVAAGVGMRGTGPPGAGTITVPALPGGSTVEYAFLYWAVMNPSTIPSLSQGSINGNAITGSLIGKTADPCWMGAGDIHNYVADVTSYVLPGAANSLTGFASGGDLTTPPVLEGASLVVLYSNPALPKRTVIIHEGAISFILPPPESTTMSGFDAQAGTSQTTFIVADGQQDPGGVIGLNNRTYIDSVLTASYTLNGAGPGTQYWDTLTQDISAFIPPGDTDVLIEVESAADLGVADCLTWVAQVLSVPAPSVPHLTVEKVVINDNGGVATPDGFTLRIDGSPVTRGVPYEVTVGTHTVSEDPYFGYVGTIGGDCNPDGTVTLALGDDKTCIITNDDMVGVGGIVDVQSNRSDGSATPYYIALAVGLAAAAMVAAAGAWYARRRMVR